MNKNKNNKARLSGTQIVTLLTALFSLVSAGLAAYFQFVLPQNIAIRATRTSEAQALTVNPPLTPNTSNASQVSPTTILENSEDTWKNNLNVKADRGNYCPIALKFPDDINPLVDPVKAIEAVYSQQESGLINTWLGVPVPRGAISLTISGLPNNISWVKIANEADVSISVDTAIPDHVNVIRDCAGGGEIRDFEAITLESDFKEYSLSVSYPDADFFTLQPGELEEFRFSFICKSPGAYQLNIEVPYEYENSDGLVQLLSYTLLCPKAFTEWSVLAGNSQDGVISMRSYEWNGKDYVDTSK